MRPLKLTMSAFGSFADAQTIDFTELGDNGIYLITGDTGAGKTTIFDAISFALFGKASGDGRGDYQMLRSDFSDEKTKTFVELDFSSAGSRYSIRRTIKKTGQDAVLVLPGGASISGDRSIKPKVAEIIGLDRDQFAQIVMIAQNDFLRFLHSGVDERLKILRRIFGTEALKDFQERLKALAKSEGDKRLLILHDFERYDVDAYKRDEQFAEWEAQVRSDKAELSEADRRLDIYDKEKQRLAADIAVAEDLYRKFSDLAENRTSLEAHKAGAERISGMEKRADRGETALRKIKPLAGEAQKAAADHISARVDLESAAESEATANAELSEAERAAGVLPPPDEARDAFSALSKEHAAAAEKLKNLTALQTDREDIMEKQVLLTAVKNDLNAALEALGKLPPAADRQAELDRITSDLDAAAEKLTKLSLLQGDYNIIAEKQVALAKERLEFETISVEFSDSCKKYLRLENTFLRSQAGIIASGLSDGAPCPVCGSTVHPAPALLSYDGITEEQLKKARAINDAAQSKREKKSSLCGSLSAELETLVKRFIVDISKFAPDVTIESAPALLEEGVCAAQAAASVLSEKKTAVEGSLSRLKVEFENASKKRDELTPKAASLQSEIDTLIKRFLNDFAVYSPSPEWESSEIELAGMISQTGATALELTARKAADEKALDELAVNWDAAVKRKMNAEAAVRSAQTLKVERAAGELKLSKIRDEAQAAYMAALRDNGFAGEAEYTDSLITEKELSELRKQVSDHEKNGEQLSRDAARLESETAGREPPDVEGLRAEADTIHIESEMLGKKRDEINSRSGKTENALRELRRAAVDLEKAEKKYAAVKQLSDTANGKLDFETYAQMAYFERILYAANLRLQLMSQNRYTMLRKTEGGDGRRRSGLEIEVFDAYTGRARPASGLSGGESFMASLSLALGLSDVVQQNAGGIRLEAMFIDEGFGSLDAEVLELAVRTLSEMAGTGRIIGVISHVTELRERIDKQIRVEKTIAGSKIHIKMN